MHEATWLRSQQLVCLAAVCLAAGGCMPKGEIGPEGSGAAGASGTAANGGEAGRPTAGSTAAPVAGSNAIGAAGSGPTAGSAAGSNASAPTSMGNGGRSAAGSAEGTAGMSGSAAPVTAKPGDTWKATDGTLFDSCGEKVVLRGINHPTAYVDREGKALPEIAKTGANAVRLFWQVNVKIAEAETAIAASIKNGMVPILELHDSTCKWNLDPIVSFWTSAQAVSLIQKYQSHLIINIANETSPPNANEFKSKYSSVVQQMRSAGIHVPLMIDGGNCGRDYNVLLSQGPALVEADPDHNLIFSAHLYDRMNAAGYAKVYTDAAAKKLTFIVGEFAHKTPPGCGAALDYTALITEADKNDIGWLAWSWGDNDPNTDWNSDCGEFDMATTFSFDTLRGWGKEVSVSLPASIENTSVRPKSLVMGACN
ncbi:MAG TPA: cellulase family glycosylhydrolase [Polyangiales bacterium]|nr:cellulase family glycosylhydrolase [Polyangiales bacterium]